MRGSSSRESSLVPAAPRRSSGPRPRVLADGLYGDGGGSSLLDSHAHGHINPEEVSEPPNLAVDRYDHTRERIIQNSTTPPDFVRGPVFGYIPERGPGRLTPRAMVQAAAAAEKQGALGGRPQNRLGTKAPLGAKSSANAAVGSGELEEVVEKLPAPGDDRVCVPSGAPGEKRLRIALAEEGREWWVRVGDVLLVLTDEGPPACLAVEPGRAADLLKKPAELCKDGCEPELDARVLCAFQNLQGKREHSFKSAVSEMQETA